MNSVVIAGSRSFKNRGDLLVRRAIKESGYKIHKIISGEAQGIDLAAKRYALNHGITYQGFPANWKKYGKPAGMIRNKEMAINSIAGIIIWDGVSTGSLGMISCLIKIGNPFFLLQWNGIKFIPKRG